MNPDLLTAIGTILKPKNLQGAVVVQLADFVFDYLDNNPALSHLFIRRKQQTKVLPHFIEKLEWRGAEVVLKLEDSDNRTDAESLRGATLLIETEKIAPYVGEEEEQEWDFLMDYTIIDTNNNEIGTISDLFYLPANALAQVMIEGKEVLIPLHEDLVELLDEKQKIIVLHIPDGLIDLYLYDNDKS